MSPHYDDPHRRLPGARHPQDVVVPAKPDLNKRVQPLRIEVKVNDKASALSALIAEVGEAARETWAQLVAQSIITELDNHVFQWDTGEESAKAAIVKILKTSRESKA